VTQEYDRLAPATILPKTGTKSMNGSPNQAENRTTNIFTEPAREQGLG
jgi:hypothetical protein